MDIQFATSPTDMMHRRTPLPFCGRFLWLGASVTIHTDSPAILRAAEETGFLPQIDAERQPDMRWEIASERTSAAPAYEGASKVTIDNHSLFLSMGREQWFAFDFESGDGAGFVAVTDRGLSGDRNAAQYLFEIACHVGNCLRTASERSLWS